MLDNFSTKSNWRQRFRNINCSGQVKQALPDWHHQYFEVGPQLMGVTWQSSEAPSHSILHSYQDKPTASISFKFSSQSSQLVPHWWLEHVNHKAPIFKFLPPQIVSQPPISELQCTLSNKSSSSIHMSQRAQRGSLYIWVCFSTFVTSPKIGFCKRACYTNKLRLRNM